MALIGRAQNGAAEFEDADSVLGAKQNEIAGRQESFKAIAEADDFPAEFRGGADDAVDDCVEAGAIAAAIENANFHNGKAWVSDWREGKIRIEEP